VKVDIAFGVKCEVYTDAEKLVKKYNLDMADYEYVDGRATHLEKNGQTKFTMYLADDSFKTIAHEASHIADYASEFFDIVNDEFRAYVVGHLVDQIVYKLRKKK